MNYDIKRQEKYEKERQSILAENKEIKENLKTLENDYTIKLKQEIRKVENKYEDEIYHLEKDNKFLRKVIKTFEKTLNKFINWVCKKFSVSEEEDFIRDFQKETDTYINPEKQIEYEQECEYDDLELQFSNKFSHSSLIIKKCMLYL